MVRLTADYIVKCNGHTKRNRDEPTNRYLKRITHLYMAERNIEAIDNLSACRNLTVLYLYDNKLNRTLNLGTAQTLTHLYLQNNHITKIEGINHLYRLTKLYIGYNNISVIEGLHGLIQLRELHIEHQRIPTGEKVLFDPRTLIGLSKCLCVLNVSGNHMDTLSELSILKEIQHLIANDNMLNDFEDLSEAIGSWRSLQKLELTGNPICHKSKYRDHVIIMTQSLESLDGKQINNLERKFLMSWKASKEARRKSRLENRISDLPPLHQMSHPPAPPPHYSVGGLPGARKRFEAILAKSRSLPASAMPVQEQKRMQQYSSPVFRQQQHQQHDRQDRANGNNGFMEAKSVSDLTNRKSQRQMTPHPNATRKAQSLTQGNIRGLNGAFSDALNSSDGMKSLSGSFSGAIMGQRRNFMRNERQQRFMQKTSFQEQMQRFSKEASSDQDITGHFPNMADHHNMTFPMNGREERLQNGRNHSSKFGKPVFPVRRPEVQGDQIELVGPLAPLPSPRIGGEGGDITDTTPKQVTVSP